MTDHEREKLMSDMPPELQQAMRMLDRAAEDVKKGDGHNLYERYKGNGTFEEFKRPTNRKTMWQRVGKVVKWWLIIYGGLMLLGSLFYALDAIGKSR